MNRTPMRAAAVTFGLFLGTLLMTQDFDVTMHQTFFYASAIVTYVLIEWWEKTQ